MNKLDDLVIYFKRFLEDENNYKKSEKLRSWSIWLPYFLFGTVILNSVTVLDSWIISADTTVYFVYFVLFILNTDTDTEVQNNLNAELLQQKVEPLFFWLGNIAKLSLILNENESLVCLKQLAEKLYHPP